MKEAFYILDNGLRIKAKVLGYSSAYGRKMATISPVAGEGEVRVSLHKLSET